jgi:hypothetical protein
MCSWRVFENARQVNLFASLITGRLILPGNVSDNDQMLSYSGQWQKVLELFNQKQCRCEMIYEGQRCTNYRDRHNQGHQFALNGAGRVRAGDFESDFTDNIRALHRAFVDRLKYSSIRRSQNPRVWAQELYKESRLCGVVEIVSNRTCLACLSRTPVHVLPCSHSLCDECATGLSTHVSEDSTLVLLSHCPFGCNPWQLRGAFTVRRKPMEAGVRVLSFDGYGHFSTTTHAANYIYL